MRISVFQLMAGCFALIVSVHQQGHVRALPDELTIIPMLEEVLKNRVDRAFSKSTSKPDDSAFIENAWHVSGKALQINSSHGTERTYAFVELLHATAQLLEPLQTTHAKVLEHVPVPLPMLNDRSSTPSYNAGYRRDMCIALRQQYGDKFDLQRCLSSSFATYTPGSLRSLEAEVGPLGCLILGDSTGVFRCMGGNGGAMIMGAINGSGYIAVQQPYRCKITELSQACPPTYEAALQLADEAVVDADMIFRGMSAPGWNPRNRKPLSPLPGCDQEIPCFSVGEIIQLSGFDKFGNRGVFVVAGILNESSTFAMDAGAHLLRSASTNVAVLRVEEYVQPRTGAADEDIYTADESSNVASVVLAPSKQIQANASMPMALHNQKQPFPATILTFSLELMRLHGVAMQVNTTILLTGFQWPGNNGCFRVRDVQISHADSIMQLTLNKAAITCAAGIPLNTQSEFGRGNASVTLYSVCAPPVVIFSAGVKMLLLSDAILQPTSLVHMTAFVAESNAPSSCAPYAVHLQGWRGVRNNGVYRVAAQKHNVYILDEQPMHAFDGQCNPLPLEASLSSETTPPTAPVYDGSAHSNVAPWVDNANISAVFAGNNTALLTFPTSYDIKNVVFCVGNDVSDDVLRVPVVRFGEDTVLIASPHVQQTSRIYDCGGATPTLLFSLKQTHDTTSLRDTGTMNIDDAIAAAEAERNAIKRNECFDCGEHGECGVDNHCVCHPGWIGLQCSGMFMPCADKTCGGRGRCDPLRGVCVCDSNYIGEACETHISSQECPVRCVHGECHIAKGVCVCPPGWEGAACDLEACKSGFFRDSDGKCISNAANASCIADGSERDTCNRRAIRCDAAGNCVCRAPYVGKACQHVLMLSGEMHKTTASNAANAALPHEILTMMVYSDGARIKSVTRGRMARIFQVVSAPSNVLQQCFSMFDANNDGKLAGNEFIGLLRSGTTCALSVQQTARQYVFSKLDFNADNAIDGNDIHHGVLATHTALSSLVNGITNKSNNFIALQHLSVVPLPGLFNIDGHSVVKSDILRPGDVLLPMTGPLTVTAVGEEGMLWQVSSPTPLTGRYLVFALQSEASESLGFATQADLITATASKGSSNGSHVLVTQCRLHGALPRFTVGEAFSIEVGLGCCQNDVFAAHVIEAITGDVITFTPAVLLATACINQLNKRNTVWLSLHGGQRGNSVSEFVGLAHATDDKRITFDTPSPAANVGDIVILVKLQRPLVVTEIDGTKRAHLSERSEMEGTLQLARLNKPALCSATTRPVVAFQPGASVALAHDAVCLSAVHALDVLMVFDVAYTVKECVGEREIHLFAPYSGDKAESIAVNVMSPCPSDVVIAGECSFSAPTTSIQDDITWVQDFLRCPAETPWLPLTTSNSDSCDAARDATAARLSATITALQEVQLALHNDRWSKWKRDAELSAVQIHKALTAHLQVPAIITPATFPQVWEMSASKLMELPLFGMPELSRALLTRQHASASNAWCAVFPDAVGLYEGLRLCYKGNADANSDKQRKPFGSFDTAAARGGTGVGGEDSHATNAGNTPSRSKASSAASAANNRKQRSASRSGDWGDITSRSANHGGYDDGGGVSRPPKGSDPLLDPYPADFYYDDPFFWCDMTNPFGFIFCPTPIPQINILIKMMIPGLIRPVIDMIMQKFMGGQSSMLAIVDVMLPESDRLYSGIIPDLPPAPIQFATPDLMQMASDKRKEVSASNPLAGILMELDHATQTATQEQEQSQAGSTAHTAADSLLRQAGALAPALKTALADTLTQPIVDSLSPVLVPDMHHILFEHLQTTLPPSLQPYLLDTVPYKLTDALYETLARSIPDGLAAAMEAQLSIPASSVVHNALARELTVTISRSIVEGVLQSIHEASGVVKVECESCKHMQRDCHACHAAHKWLADSMKEAHKLVTHYGNYYGELYA